MKILSATPGQDDDDSRIKEEGGPESRGEATKSGDSTRRQDEERESDSSEGRPEKNEPIDGIDYGGEFNLDIGAG
jgi:hypothetical protein